MNAVEYRDLGTVDYAEGWRIQEELFEAVVARKLANRGLSESEQQPQQHYLLFCEHPHVFTLGRTGDEKNLLLNPDTLSSIDASYYKNNRGGDITYHGPGQLVGYPILDLDYFFTDIHKYMRLLEEAVILTMQEYGLKGDRYPGYTGVWMDPNDPAKARKICAMGVRCSRWVTMHGFAFNVNTNLNYFNHIVPCGISDKQVTSLQKETGRLIPMEEVKEKMLQHLSGLFGMKIMLR